MATHLGGILGGFSGTVGAVVGSIWKGIFVMRGKQQYTTNPNTVKQQERRNMFSVMLAFLKPLLGIIRLGFKSLAIGQTEFNAAMSYNIKNAITGVGIPFEVDYAAVRLTTGPIAPALTAATAVTLPDLVNFTWEGNLENPMALPTDQAYLIVVNPAKGLSVSVRTAALRDDEAKVVSIPALFSGDDLHCYVAFENYEKTDFSNTVYAGMVTAL